MENSGVKRPKGCFAAPQGFDFGGKCVIRFTNKTRTEPLPVGSVFFRVGWGNAVEEREFARELWQEKKHVHL